MDLLCHTFLKEPVHSGVFLLGYFSIFKEFFLLCVLFSLPSLIIYMIKLL